MEDMPTEEETCTAEVDKVVPTTEDTTSRNSTAEEATSRIVEDMATRTALLPKPSTRAGNKGSGTRSHGINSTIQDIIECTFVLKTRGLWCAATEKKKKPSTFMVLV